MTDFIKFFLCCFLLELLGLLMADSEQNAVHRVARLVVVSGVVLIGMIVTGNIDLHMLVE